jgi:hypothetical protein
MDMTRKRRSSVLLVLVLVAFLVSACGPKDLVSLARVDGSELYLADKYGNKVRIADGTGFLQALKKAKAVSNPEDAPSETMADYILISNDQKIYYDALGKYLIYVDKNQKKNVYTGDLTDLISSVPGLPPLVKEKSIEDPEVSSWLADFSKTEEASAILFEDEGDSSLLVTAGEKPTAGYALALEKVSLDPSGVVVLKIRVTAPQGPATGTLSYPILELTVAGNPEIEVQLVSATKSGESIEHVRLARARKDQKIIALRPERGSLVTEVVQMAGFAKLPMDSFSVSVEDGHNVLGTKTIVLSGNDSQWRHFEFSMGLQPASSPNGTVVFSWKNDDGTTEELFVPISFGGK